MDESDLSLYSLEARIGYQIVLWPIVVVGMIGNLSVLWRVSFTLHGGNSPLKPIYRGALFSLAASDLLFLISSGVNTLSTFVRPNIIWVLPDWACSLIPCLQTTAALSSSLTLATVASERYRAITPKYPPPTGPSRLIVALLVLVIWSISAAASYPVFDLYATNSLIVITGNTYYRALLCITVDRGKASLIYVILYVAIFLPLAVVFLGVHSLLALKIWGRRRRNEKSNPAGGSDSQLTETSTVTTSAARSSPIIRRRSVHSSPLPRRKQQMVKVILTLILIFIICRLPMWTFAVIKLYITLSGGIWWHVQAWVSTLSLLNTAVNPFLYAFINETLATLTWVRTWCAKTADANVTAVGPEELQKNVASIKVPRGPYSR